MSCRISFQLHTGAGSRSLSRQIIQVVALAALSIGLASCGSAIAGSQNSSAGSKASSAATVKIVGAQTVAAGGKIQFAATVTNTSNSAVVWSASAGSITAEGLFTAPSTKGPESVAVSAKSTSTNAVDSVMVTVTPPAARLAIATTTLPAGTTGTTYDATLAGTGGNQPYRWKMVSGALPTGLQLDSQAGIVSGVTGQSGSFPISVQVSDASGTTATQSLTLTMNAQSGSNCGPPSYPCSRSDTQLILAKAPPQLGSNPQYAGGHLGAGRIGVDPAYSNRILRVTDGVIDPTRLGQSYSTGSSAEKNVTSYDESLFFVHNEDGRVCLFQFEPSTFSAHFHGCFFNVGSSFDFGYTAADQRAFYSYYHQKLYRFVIDTTNWTIAADPSFNGGRGYFDPDDANCLNGQMAANRWGTGDSGLSSDDSTLITAVGPGQDRDPYYVVWNATKGCQWMNVHTWQVSRGWNTGMNNPVSVQFASGKTPGTSGGIHNAQIDRSGSFGVLAVNGVPVLDHKIFWTIGTNQVDDTCVRCQSHWACDFGVCFWDLIPGTGYGLASQDIGNLSPVSNMNTSAVLGQWGNDVHLSHANATEGERLIYLAAWQPGSGNPFVNQVWEDEIVGVNWNGSQRTIRFNKNWASGFGGFNGSARCPISRQGHYALCSTDYQMYNLDKGFGNGLNQDTCNHNLSSGHRGTNGCRSDVLLFELR